MEETAEPRINRLGVSLPILGHGLNDAYNGSFTPLLPLLSSKFDLSVGGAGTLGVLLLTSSTLFQPLFGYVADHRPKVHFVLVAPLVTALSICLVGAAGNITALAILVALAGLSTAAFHPAGAAMVHRNTVGPKSFVMGVFAGGGTLGLALGPLIVLPIVLKFGLERSYVAALPALIVTLLAGLVSRSTDQDRAQARSNGLAAHSQRVRLGKISLPFLVLWLIVVLRASVINSLRTFLPILVVDGGYSAFLGGLSVTLLFLAGTLGEISGGFLADRLGNKRIILYSLISGFPCVLGTLLTNGYLAVVFLFLAGFLLFASISVNVVMGQHLMFGQEGTAAGLMMGLAWGIGSIATAAVGFLGDVVGLRHALLGGSLLLLPAMVLALRIDEHPACSRQYPEMMESTYSFKARCHR